MQYKQNSIKFGTVASFSFLLQKGEIFSFRAYSYILNGCSCAIYCNMVCAQ